MPVCCVDVNGSCSQLHWLCVMQVGLILAFKYGTEKGNRKPQLLPNLGIKLLLLNLCRVCGTHSRTVHLHCPLFNSYSRMKCPKLSTILLCEGHSAPWKFTLRPKILISEVLWKCWASPERGQTDPNRAVNMEEPGPQRGFRSRLRCRFPCWGPHVHMDVKMRKQYQASLSVRASISNNLISHLASCLVWEFFVACKGCRWGVGCVKVLS